MRNYRISMHGRAQALAVCLLLSFLLASPAFIFQTRAVEKLKPEEVVAKHLESLGAAETRASIKNLIAAGNVVASFRAPSTGQMNGRIVIASEAEKNMVGMGFESTNYSQERFAFDGSEVTAGFARPGVRGYLADFLLTHKDILKQGLLGGVLSKSWPLLGLADKKVKLEYGGTKKIGDRQAHALKYYPRGGSDLQITLYFDTETFNHVRTEYSRVITAQMGNTIDTSARQRQTRYKMTEDFSDFKKEGGLNLPHTYTIGLEMDTRGGTFVADWKATLRQFTFNQPIETGSFNMNKSQ